MLKVVQHEQDQLFTQVVAQLNGRHVLAVKRKPQGASDSKDKQVSGIDRGQRHKVYAVRKVGALLLCGFERQACLANASGPNQRQ